MGRGCAETQDLRERVVSALSGAFGSAAAAVRATAVRDRIGRGLFDSCAIEALGTRSAQPIARRVTPGIVKSMQQLEAEYA